MLPLVFLGGALTGAAGLLTAALWDKHRTESQFSPILKNPKELDAKQAAKQLNQYFFKAQALYSECNKIVMESCELIITPIPLPDDSLLGKAGVVLGSHANKWCRGWRESQLKDVREEAKNLYARYKGVFKRANELAIQKGAPAIDLKSISYSASSMSIDRSLDNDNWDREFQDFADTIREFIENSCNIAEKLIDILEKDGESKPALPIEA